MARKKRSDSGGASGGEWLNTYADMVTLLLTFFILLFSMSTLDTDKASILAEAMMEQFGVPTKSLVQGEPSDDQQGPQDQPPEITEDTMQMIYDTLSKFIADQQMESSVQISKSDNAVFIRFTDDMLFEPNSSVLKPSDREILRFVGNGIKSVQNDCETISIHGFTASVPDNPDYPVNEWMLSAGRANAVLVFFDDEIGIDKEKMTATTWGMNKPLADNATEEGRSKNRRVEILISTENLLSEQLDNIYEKLVE